MSAPVSDERLADLRAGLDRYEQINGPDEDARDLLAEVDRARAELAAELTRRMTAEIDLLLTRKQRDEHRRSICWKEAEGRSGWATMSGKEMKSAARAIADERGWDCYPEEVTP